MLGGAALSGDGQELGSMGVDMGDYEHSGLSFSSPNSSISPTRFITTLALTASPT